MKIISECINYKMNDLSDFKINHSSEALVIHPSASVLKRYVLAYQPDTVICIKL